MARGGNGTPNFQAHLESESIGHVLDELFEEPFATAAKSVRDHLTKVPGAELYVVGGAIRDIVAGRRPKDLDIMVRGIPDAELVESLKELAGNNRLAMYQGAKDHRRQRVLDTLKENVLADQATLAGLGERITRQEDEITAGEAQLKIAKAHLDRMADEYGDDALLDEVMLAGHEVDTLSAQLTASRHQLDTMRDQERKLALRTKHQAVVLDMDLARFDEHVANVPAARRVSWLPRMKGRLGREGDHFTVTRYWHTDGTEVEVVLPRADVSTGDGHKDVDPRPDHMMDVADDMARRDFTVNAMAWDLGNREMIDPFGGQDDLENGVLRTVSEQSFKDDRLRMVRGLVLAGRYGLAPDETCDAQYADQAQYMNHVTRPRIMDEMYNKLLPSADPAFAVEIGERYGLVSYALPDMKLDVDSLRRMQETTKDPVLRLAALVHSNDPTEVRETLHSVHYETDVSNRIARLLDKTPTPAVDDTEAIAGWINAMQSRDNAVDIVRLRALAANDRDASAKVEALRGQFDRPIFRSEIALTGKDLIAAGVEPGEHFGELLSRAQAHVWGNPADNEKSKLLSVLGIK